MTCDFDFWKIIYDERRSNIWKKTCDFSKRIMKGREGETQERKKVYRVRSDKNNLTCKCNTHVKVMVTRLPKRNKTNINFNQQQLLHSSLMNLNLREKR